MKAALARLARARSFSPSFLGESRRTYLVGSSDLAEARFQRRACQPLSHREGFTEPAVFTLRPGLSRLDSVEVRDDV